MCHACRNKLQANLKSMGYHALITLMHDVMKRGNLPHLMQECHFARFLSLREEEQWLDDKGEQA